MIFQVIVFFKTQKLNPPYNYVIPDNYFVKNWSFENIITETLHTHTFTSTNTGGGQSHTNVQPYIVMNYIIKY
jgi:microcystin-dependent protein